MQRVERSHPAVFALIVLAALVAPLALTDVALAYQSILVIPGSVSFGPVRVGGREYSSVTVENNGDEDITFLSVLPIGDSSQLFVTNTCGYLPRYGSCMIQLEYSPTREGFFSSQINIYGQGASGTVFVSGEGVQ